MCIRDRNYCPAPIVLGLILGSMIDENFRRALTVSSGDFSIFVTRPISLVFLVVIILTVLNNVRPKKSKAK